MGINMSKVKINQILVISLLGFGLTACGGGGGGSNVKVYSGVFKDSNVQGFHYTSGSQEGITGKNGEFKYEENSSVSFSVGGINFGSAKAKNVMTPKDLVTKGKVDTPEVLNRVRFLMMLDKDNNPANGIEISEKVQNKAKSWSAISFAKDKFPSEKAGDYKTEASVADAKVHKFPTLDEAKTHFSSTLETIKTTERCSDAGAFTGTYNGSESGNIALILDPSTGDIKGTLFNTDKSGNYVPSLINKTTAINYDIQSRKFVSLSESGIKLSGQLTGSNVLEGTWVSKDDSKRKGTFIAKRIGGNGGAAYRYNAIFKGNSDNDLGVLAIDKDSSNKLTGKTYDVKTGKEATISGKESNAQFADVKISDGSKISGFISKTSLSGTILEKSGTTNAFTGNGCKLN
jgi:hypothetical protein